MESYRHGENRETTMGTSDQTSLIGSIIHTDIMDIMDERNHVHSAGRPQRAQQAQRANGAFAIDVRGKSMEEAIVGVRSFMDDLRGIYQRHGANGSYGANGANGPSELSELPPTEREAIPVAAPVASASAGMAMAAPPTVVPSNASAISSLTSNSLERRRFTRSHHTQHTQYSPHAPTGNTDPNHTPLYATIITGTTPGGNQIRFMLQKIFRNCGINFVDSGGESFQADALSGMSGVGSETEQGEPGAKSPVREVREVSERSGGSGSDDVSSLKDGSEEDMDGNMGEGTKKRAASGAGRCGEAAAAVANPHVPGTLPALRSGSESRSDNVSVPATEVPPPTVIAYPISDNNPNGSCTSKVASSSYSLKPSSHGSQEVIRDRPSSKDSQDESSHKASTLTGTNHDERNEHLPRKEPSFVMDLRSKRLEEAIVDVRNFMARVRAAHSNAGMLSTERPPLFVSLVTGVGDVAFQKRDMLQKIFRSCSILYTDRGGDSFEVDVMTGVDLDEIYDIDNEQYLEEIPQCGNSFHLNAVQNEVSASARRPAPQSVSSDSSTMSILKLDVRPLKVEDAIVEVRNFIENVKETLCSQGGAHGDDLENRLRGRGPMYAKVITGLGPEGSQKRSVLKRIFRKCGLDFNDSAGESLEVDVTSGLGNQGSFQRKKSNGSGGIHSNTEDPRNSGADLYLRPATELANGSKMPGLPTTVNVPVAKSSFVFDARGKKMEDAVSDTRSYLERVRSAYEEGVLTHSGGAPLFVDIITGPSGAQTRSVLQKIFRSCGIDFIDSGGDSFQVDALSGAESHNSNRSMTRHSSSPLIGRDSVEPIISDAMSGVNHGRVVDPNRMNEIHSAPQGTGAIQGSLNPPLNGFNPGMLSSQVAMGHLQSFHGRNNVDHGLHHAASRYGAFQGGHSQFISGCDKQEIPSDPLQQHLRGQQANLMANDADWRQALDISSTPREQFTSYPPSNIRSGERDVMSENKCLKLAEKLSMDDEEDRRKRVNRYKLELEAALQQSKKDDSQLVEQEEAIVEMVSRQSLMENSDQNKEVHEFEEELELALRQSAQLELAKLEEEEKIKRSEEQLLKNILAKSEQEEERARFQEEELMKHVLLTSRMEEEHAEKAEKELLSAIMKQSLETSERNDDESELIKEVIKKSLEEDRAVNEDDEMLERILQMSLEENNRRERERRMMFEHNGEFADYEHYVSSELLDRTGESETKNRTGEEEEGVGEEADPSAACN